MNAEPLQVRFDAAVDTNAGPDACHPWTRARDRDGYGSIKLGRKTLRANRVAYFLAHGRWPEVARHTCDNPPCCNATHVVDGTDRDNKQDMRERGRSLTGSRNPNARLTLAQVQEIKSSAESIVELAARFGVQKSAISKIRTGRTWKSA